MQNIVLDNPYNHILGIINDIKLPCFISFVDRGVEYEVIFEQKPLGFSIIKDENNRNAKVCRITTIECEKAGVKLDSFLINVNHHHTWGMSHNDIMMIMKNENLPIKCRFRTTPRLKCKELQKP